jgi:hypothetical protein
VKAKGDFCEKITLEHDAHPQIIRALKGRTEFFGWRDPTASNTRAFSTFVNHLPSLRDESYFASFCQGNTNAKLLHPGGMAACSRWLSPNGRYHRKTRIGIQHPEGMPDLRMRSTDDLVFLP